MLYISTFGLDTKSGPQRESGRPRYQQSTSGLRMIPYGHGCVGPGAYMACDFLHIYQTTTKQRIRNSSYNVPACDRPVGWSGEGGGVRETMRVELTSEGPSLHGVWGERCKLPHRGLGRSLSSFATFTMLKSQIKTSHNCVETPKTDSKYDKNYFFASRV